MFPEFGFFLAVMGAIGLCIIVAGAFINIEKLTVVGEILLSAVIGGIIFPFVPKKRKLRFRINDKSLYCACDACILFYSNDNSSDEYGEKRAVAVLNIKK